MSNTHSSDKTPVVEHNASESTLNKKGKKKGKRSGIIRVAILIAVIIAMAAGIPFYLHEISHESSDDAFIDGHIISVSPRVSSHIIKVLVNENQMVKKGDLLAELDPKDFQAKFDAAVANLEAAKATYQSNKISVDLTSITTAANVNEARASVNLAKAEVQTAEAGVDAARSQIDLARAQLEHSKSMLAQSKADLEAAVIKHRLDKTDLSRSVQMAGTISKQQLDHANAAEKVSAAELSAAEKKVDAQKAMISQSEAVLKAAKDGFRQSKTRLNAARARLVQAKARYDAAKAAPQHIEKSRSQAKAALADIDKARAAVEQARLNLSYTKIHAPIDGYVTQKYAEVGIYVQTGQSLMSIVRSDVWVTANFKETQLTRMRPGQPVVIKVDTFPDVEFNGHVESIQHGTGARFSLLPPENATGNYVKVVQRVPVKIVFDHQIPVEKYLLIPGMSVVPEVDIKAEGRKASKDSK